MGIYDDIFKDIKAYLYERLNNPLSGAFIISWSLWNYDILIILFSAVPAYETVKYIKDNINLSHGIILPMLTALSFVFVYPYPAKYIYKFWHRRQKEIKEIKQRIDDVTPLTMEESRFIRRQLWELEEKYQQTITHKDDQIEDLKQEIVANQNTISGLQEEINKNQEEINKYLQAIKTKTETTQAPKENISDEQIEMLKLIAHSNNEEMSFDQVMRAMTVIPTDIKQDKISVKYNLDELVRLGYLKYDYNQRVHEYTYRLEHAGREVLVKIQPNQKGSPTTFS